MLSRLWIVMLAVIALGLGGCPKPQAKTHVAVTKTPPANVTVPPTESASSETPASDETPAADEQKQADAARPGGSGDGTHKPTTQELQGTWFALYGGVGMGSKTYTYENGHQIEFLDNGMAVWTVHGSGGNQFQVASSWKMGTGDIQVTVDKPDSISKGVESTPLAFGRDDEVGLTGAQSENQPVLFTFTPHLTDGFLALEGKNHELMVYGRVANGAPAAAPNIAGDWQLVSAPGQTYDVTVKQTDDQMEVTWGPFHNTFKGQYTHGYFVGEVTGSAGTAIAAVMPAAGGKLDGVISAEPYSSLQTTFNFTRAAH